MVCVCVRVRVSEDQVHHVRVRWLGLSSARSSHGQCADDVSRCHGQRLQAHSSQQISTILSIYPVTVTLLAAAAATQPG